MNTWKRRMATVGCALAVLALLTTASTDALAQTPAVDPAAVQVLKRMTVSRRIAAVQRGIHTA